MAPSVSASFQCRSNVDLMHNINYVKNVVEVYCVKSLYNIIASDRIFVRIAVIK